MKMHSIVSIDAAHRLLTLLPHDPTPVSLPIIPDGTGRKEGVTLTARRLTKLGRTRKGAQTSYLSGGVKIMATTRQPEYGGPSLDFTRRLRPNWTPKQFVRAASMCFLEARAACHRFAHAESVYKLVGESVSPTILSLVGTAELESGHTSIYADMTPDDAAFWMAWFSERKV